MGYDAFGLPAEQYAIQTGQHPAITTQKNIARYREQLDKIGFSFDWSREIQTCDPKYYKWTQWAFIRMFHSYYDNQLKKARPISELVEQFSRQGTSGLDAACTEPLEFTAEEWNSKSEKEQQQILMNYRIAYLGDTMVNWCPQLGTVLANDEVSEGVSIRGGYPVEQKKMRQWCLRVSAYAQRLLDGLETIEWTDSLKDTQRNWIGRSEGAVIHFNTSKGITFDIFTTRADTIFGVTFMVLAPESELVGQLTTDEYREAVQAYIEKTKKKTERERIADKSVSGVFSGAYAIHPFTGEKLPIWISDYVLAGYGTGAIMAVPAHDSRDYALPNISICQFSSYRRMRRIAREFRCEGRHHDKFRLFERTDCERSHSKAIDEIQNRGLGYRKVNYACVMLFSRVNDIGVNLSDLLQRWMPYTLDESELPLELPEVDKFLPTETGEPLLGRAKNWKTKDGYPLELNTMPGFAGSSAYYLRYMDPHNDEALVSKNADEYWRNVDLYVGGTEHATGHLIYSRFWNKFLFDLGISCEEEPFKKLVNQGMIQGRSNFVYRIKGTNTFVSFNLKDKYDVTPIHVDVNIVHNDVLDIEAFRNWNPEYKTAEFILEDGKYICGWAVEKMSKSMFNVVNPDDIVESYGADTLRLYEMFLGPLEQSKPWDTNGIDGVYRFLRRFWNLFFEGDKLALQDSEPTRDELKSIHKLIKKVTSDIETFSFNTAVSAS
jgi:leucyl-tRNA synthetase